MTTTETMTLWNSVCETDPKYTKEVRYGKRHFTAVNAQYQKRMATELWGPYGTKWGLRDLKFGHMGPIAADGTVSPNAVVLTAVFFWPGGSFEIAADDKFEAGEDTYKKIQTDILTKSLSYLGFSADVFLGFYDDNKYVQKMGKQHSEVYENARDFLAKQPSDKDLGAILPRLAERQNDGALSKAHYHELHVETLIRLKEFEKAKDALNMLSLPDAVKERLAALATTVNAEDIR